MNAALQYSMFHKVLFPEIQQVIDHENSDAFVLSRVIRYLLDRQTSMKGLPIVLFDFETTGFDPHSDRIIEIGAMKILDGEIVGEFSSLVNPERPLSSASKTITGISDDMLVGQPKIGEVLPKFMEFFSGAVLVAHNAEFDMGFLRANAGRLGVLLSWPCYCTLKLARAYLPQLESRSLDALAQFYGLSFEARHRSIGDVKVTAAVLQKLLHENMASLSEWQHFAPFTVND